MSRVSAMFLSLLALLVFGSAMATPAFASPEWWVSGNPLSGSEKLAGSPTVVKSFVIANSGLKIECSKVGLVGGVIGQTNKNNLELFEFRSCIVPGNTNCEVANFKTEPLNFPLQGEKGNIKLNFRPVSGTLVALITIKEIGSTCSAKGTHKLTSGPKSGMVCNYPAVESEHIEHELQFGEGSGSEVELDAKAATFTGVIKFSLESGHEWSAR